MSLDSAALYAREHLASTALAVIIVVTWIVGWVAILSATEFAPDARWYQRFAGCVLLFFIWPYIAMCMNTDR